MSDSSNPAAACDLHMHSTASDGTDSPAELVAMAARLGLAAIALTDHDTVDGLAEATAAGRAAGVRVLSGVEISVEHSGHTVHMLGYCFDGGVAGLADGLAGLRAGRDARNHRIVERLNELGVAITYDDVAARAGGKVVGRPHFAAAMVAAGAVADTREAFAQYLGEGGRAYFDRLQFGPAQSIEMIRAAGGVAVLAHPKLIRLAKGETLAGLLAGLVDAGLGGIECHYSLHDDAETAEFLALAERFGLVATGGSDYHGRNKPDIAMGSGLGGLRVPLSTADALEARAAAC